MGGVPTKPKRGAGLQHSCCFQQRKLARHQSSTDHQHCIVSAPARTACRATQRRMNGQKNIFQSDCARRPKDTSWTTSAPISSSLDRTLGARSHPKTAFAELDARDKIFVRGNLDDRDGGRPTIFSEPAEEQRHDRHTQIPDDKTLAASVPSPCTTVQVRLMVCMRRSHYGKHAGRCRRTGATRLRMAFDTTSARASPKRPNHQPQPSVPTNEKGRALARPLGWCSLGWCERRISGLRCRSIQRTHPDRGAHRDLRKDCRA